ncbi:uncharacterized protein METZ01_LOCUS188319 [marine metagenome]|uniref:Uncharacterized protein n=1 Tax=marine metagenome TaxID=408172 RepID=A0A382DB35_9ZZZZ
MPSGLIQFKIQLTRPAPVFPLMPTLSAGFRRLGLSSDKSRQDLVSGDVDCQIDIQPITWWCTGYT